MAGSGPGHRCLDEIHRSKPSAVTGRIDRAAHRPHNRTDIVTLDELEAAADQSVLATRCTAQ
jgi:hypothetical protein